MRSFTSFATLKRGQPPDKDKDRDKDEGIDSVKDVKRSGEAGAQTETETLEAKEKVFGFGVGIGLGFGFGVGSAGSSEASSSGVSCQTPFRHLGDFLARELQQGRLVLHPYIDEASIVKDPPQPPNQVRAQVLTQTQAGTRKNQKSGGVETSDRSRHVEYAIKYGLRLDIAEEDFEYKRYSRFKELDEQLKAKFPRVDLPKLPQRRWLKLSRRSLDPEYIERKSEDLARYLQELGQIEGVKNSKEFLRFILGQRYDEFLNLNEAGFGQELKHVDSYSSSTSIPQSIGEVDGKYSLNSGAIDSSIGAQWKNGRKIFVAPSKSQLKLPLYKQKSCSEENHPFISKLIDKESHAISVEATYRDAEDVLSSKSLILTFCEDPLIDVQLTLYPVSFRTVEDSRVAFHAEAVIDGHALSVSGSLCIHSLRGKMVLESVGVSSNGNSW